MPTNLLRDLEIIENTEEMATPTLDTAVGYAVKSDVRAGQCPVTTVLQRYKGDDVCRVATPC